MAKPTASIPEQVREGCAWVAERARSVGIEKEAIETYAAGLDEGGGGAETASEPGSADPANDPGGGLGAEADREARAAFVICLDAINFGSGWWPTIRKRPGHSGYRTIEAALAERFRGRSAWSAAELVDISPAELAAVLGQDPEHQLMAEFAASLRNVGSHVYGDHGGRFEAVVGAAGGSAVAMAGLLAGWEAFADTSTYEGRRVPFFKRAQIAASDLDRVGVAEFGDLDRLTAFADNLVPHVLRLDGVLRLAPELSTAIDAGELLEHGSAAEVELRACTVQAVELLSGARRAGACGPPLTAAEIDAALWNRGRGRRYKSRPRPRSRNTAY